MFQLCQIHSMASIFTIHFSMACCPISGRNIGKSASIQSDSDTRHDTRCQSWLLGQRTLLTYFMDLGNVPSGEFDNGSGPSSGGIGMDENGNA